MYIIYQFHHPATAIYNVIDHRFNSLYYHIRIYAVLYIFMDIWFNILWFMNAQKFLNVSCSSCNEDKYTKMYAWSLLNSISVKNICMNHIKCSRPYCHVNDRSLPTSESKHGEALLVLASGMRWEPKVLASFRFFGACLIERQVMIYCSIFST